MREGLPELRIDRIRKDYPELVPRAVLYNVALEGAQTPADYERCRRLLDGILRYIQSWFTTDGEI